MRKVGRAQRVQRSQQGGDPWVAGNLKQWGASFCKDAAIVGRTAVPNVVPQLPAEPALNLTRGFVRPCEHAATQLAAHFHDPHTGRQGTHDAPSNQPATEPGRLGGRGGTDRHIVG